MEKPILFSTPMVQAILAERKTMTRRVIKGANGKPPTGKWMGEIIPGGNWCSNPRTDLSWTGFYTENNVFYVDGEKRIDGIYCKCQYRPGDILWVRETWCNINKPEYPPEYYYLADCLQPWIEDYNPNEWKWKPSIHMPRTAARLFLKVTNIRVERLQDITEEDAMAEGIAGYWAEPHKDVPPFIGVAKEAGADLCRTRRKAFQQLWDSLNAKRGYGWDMNPWVWVIEFERVKVAQ